MKNQFAKVQKKKNISHEYLWCSCCMKMFKVCKAKAQSFFFKQFICFWLCWVFAAVAAFLQLQCGPGAGGYSLVAAWGLQ